MEINLQLQSKLHGSLQDFKLFLFSYHRVLQNSSQLYSELHWYVPGLSALVLTYYSVLQISLEYRVFSARLCVWISLTPLTLDCFHTFQTNAINRMSLPALLLQVLPASVHTGQSRLWGEFGVGPSYVSR